MTDKDFKNFMNEDGKDLKWNNYYEPLDGDKNKVYKGQWNEDRTYAHGLGIFIQKGADGFTYQGMMK